MREPVRTTRTGRGVAHTQPMPASQPSQPRRRLRTRLLAAVVVTVIAVPAAGGPSIATAVRDLSESQRLLRLTQLNTSAIALSHALADERDDMTAFVAAGRSTSSGHQVSQDERLRVDRQAADLGRATAALDTGGSPDLVRVTGDLRTSLAGVAGIRQSALGGHGSAKTVFDSYSPVIDTLDTVSGALARALPARAADPDTSAGPALAEAVSQSSAEHGLLVAALIAGGSSAPLVGGAQLARVREDAAFADFSAAATAAARTQYAQTVTGSDVTAGDAYLRRLTAKPYLTGSDNLLRTADVDAALSARIDRMRAVQSSLAGADTTRLTSLRDDDVTALEMRIALVGLCTLLALGMSVQTARSVTRPLARLRRYATEPVGAPPVASGDEFASVALAVERLAQDLAALREETAGADAERARLADVRESAAAERDELRRRQAALLQERAELAQEKDALVARLGSLQGTVSSTFVNLSLRTLALVERQLALIEGLENREQDPDELETLFRLDHLATRMRRNSESLLVLAGADTGGGAMAKPVPLVDVVRAGISEIERYERVRIPFLPRTQLVGFAADDAAHLVAELLENATAFSPPQAEVQVSGWLLENGEVMLSVEDAGIGIPEGRLSELNRLLADPRPDESTTSAGLGLYVVARLAGRHGIRVQLREQKQGGVAAVVVLPRALVTGPPETDWTPAPAATSAGPSPSVGAGRRPQRPERTPDGVGAPEGRPGAGTGRPTAAGQHAAAPGAAEHARPHTDEAGPGGSSARPRHTTGPDQARPVTPEQAEDPAGDGQDAAAGGNLPKRVPRASGLTGEPAARGRGAPVDADALRRKLGGFAQGLREGRRDAQAEDGEQPPLPGPRTPGDRSDSEPSEEARG